MSDIGEQQRAQRVAAAARGNVSQKARRETDPHRVGSRTLLAKTCTKCGELQPGSAFYFTHASSRTNTCTRCRRRSAAELLQQNAQLRMARNRKRNLRQKHKNDVMPQSRGGYLWTGPEMEIIERDDLTAHQAGVMIGRSRNAVATMRKRIRDEPKLQRVLGAQS